jgi:ribulose bisphosphate carboxylase small subunit
MKKPYIIAIDDDLSVLRAVERALKAQFSTYYRVLTADSPQKAMGVVRVAVLAPQENGGTIFESVRAVRYSTMSG